MLYRRLCFAEPNIFFRLSPERRNRTPACLHAPGVEVQSEHQPDSPWQSDITFNWMGLLYSAGNPSCTLNTWTGQPCMTPAGLEPVIPGSVSRCLIHWATGPSGGDDAQAILSASVALGGGRDRGSSPQPAGQMAFGATAGKHP